MPSAAAEYLRLFLGLVLVGLGMAALLPHPEARRDRAPTDDTRNTHTLKPRE